MLMLRSACLWDGEVRLDGRGKITPMKANTAKQQQPLIRLLRGAWEEGVEDADDGLPTNLIISSLFSTASGSSVRGYTYPRRLTAMLIMGVSK
jgi:hypothetical protein